MGRSVHRSEELAEVAEFRHKMQSEESARDLQNQSAGGRDAQSVDHAEVAEF